MLIMFSCASYLLAVGTPQYWDERVRLAEECAGWPRQGVSTQTLGLAIWYCGMVQLAQGERAQAEGLWRQFEELAERTRVATVGLFVAQREIVMAVIDGRLEQALILLRRFVDLADELGAPTRGRVFVLRQLIAPALYLGRANIWLTTSEEFVAPPPFDAARAMCLAQVGRLEEARTVAEPVLNNAESSIDERRIQELVMLLRAAVAVKDRAASQVVGARLAGVAHVTREMGTHTCIARHLGEAAALAGDRGLRVVTISRHWRRLARSASVPNLP